MLPQVCDESKCLCGKQPFDGGTLPKCGDDNYGSDCSCPGNLHCNVSGMPLCLMGTCVY